MIKNRLTIVWSPKGGVGVTTTTALISLRTTEQHVVTSFDQDLACVLGQTPDTPEGLTSWINNDDTNTQPLSQQGTGISNFARFVPPRQPDNTRCRHHHHSTEGLWE